MKARALVAMVFVITMIGGSAWGAPSQMLFAYPGYTAQWQKGGGVPDGSNSQHGLHLEKVDPTPTDPEDDNTSGVVFGNLSGTTLTELGFDVRNDGLCGAYPRYKVITSDNNVYFFRCQSGTHTSSFENWTRVRFSSLDAEPASLGQPLFLFPVQIEHLSLAFHLDAGSAGFTNLDNLDINGTLIGKPGR